MTDVLNQWIWYNSYIKKGKSDFFYNKRMHQQELNTIRDIYDLQLGAFLTYEQFTQKYGALIDFVTYYGILSAIPLKWKRLLSHQFQNFQPQMSGIDKLYNCTSVSKQIYDGIHG